MAQVPGSFVPDVAADMPRGNDYEDIQTNPNQFGASIGAGMEKLGEGASKLGGTIGAAAIDMQSLDNEKTVNKVQNDYQSKVNSILYDPQNGYYNKSGDDARNGAPDALAAINKARDDALGSLGNGRQQVMFDQLTRRMHDYNVQAMSSHADQEGKKADIETTQSGIQTFGSTAVMAGVQGDIPAFDSAINQINGLTQSAARINGLSPDSDWAKQHAQTQIGAVVKNTVAQLVDMGQISRAQQIAGKYYASMDKGSQLDVDQKLKTGVDSLTAFHDANAALEGRPLPSGGSATQSNVVPITGTPSTSSVVPPVAAPFLAFLSQGESAGKNVRYTGSPTGEPITDETKHPGIPVPLTSGPNAGKTSDAAGYYQFLGSTWRQEQTKLGLTDFSKPSQDVAAWDLASTTYQNKTGGRDLSTDLKAGYTDLVVPALKDQWPSLSGYTGRDVQGGMIAAAVTPNAKAVVNATKGNAIEQIQSLVDQPGSAYYNRPDLAQKTVEQITRLTQADSFRAQSMALAQKQAVDTKINQYTTNPDKFGPNELAKLNADMDLSPTQKSEVLHYVNEAKDFALKGPNKNYEIQPGAFDQALTELPKISGMQDVLEYGKPQATVGADGQATWSQPRLTPSGVDQLMKAYKDSDSYSEMMAGMAALKRQIGVDEMDPKDPVAATLWASALPQIYNAAKAAQTKGVPPSEYWSPDSKDFVGKSVAAFNLTEAQKSALVINRNAIQDLSATPLDQINSLYHSPATNDYQKEMIVQELLKRGMKFKKDIPAAPTPTPAPDVPLLGFQ